VTKTEFVERFAAQAGLSKKDAQAATDAFIAVIAEALTAGEEVQFTGFGKFYVQERDAREGINPQTKEKITIAATKVPKFSAGTALKNAVR